jgi:calpain-15
MRLCNGGLWEYVDVDDFFPCSRIGGELLCANANSNELWVLLLEKACAKLFGNYPSLNRGEECEGLMYLTGQVSLTVNVRTCMSSTCAVNEGAPVVTYHWDEGISAERKNELWNIIFRASCEGYVVTIGANTDDLRDNGILSNHSYTVLKVWETSHHSDRILKLRNPWGN